MKYLLFLCVLLLASCNTNPAAETIREALRDKQGISCSEWKTIRAAASKRTTDSDLLNDIQSIAESARRSLKINIPVPVDQCNTHTAPTTQEAYNLYLENSGSMNGYINGNSEFKRYIFSLLTRINSRKQTITPFFIENDLVTPVNWQPAQLIDSLNTATLQRIRKSKETDINQILKKVVEQFKRDGKTALLVSDFIYSVNPDKGDVAAQLAAQKTKTTLVFQAAKDADCAVMVIRNESAFDGKYYPYNAPFKGIPIRETRPYYIWVIGKTNAILNFSEANNITDYDGYTQHLTLYNPNNAVPFYTILPQTNKIGTFRKSKNETDRYTTLEAPTLDDRKKQFQFATAIDFSSFPIDNAYLTNPSNYEIVSSRGDAFSVQSVQPILQMHKNDERYKGSATHIVTLQTTSLRKDPQTLHINLLSTMPAWVATTHTDDDTTPALRNHRTFGIRYLIEGVSEAYYPRGDKNLYFSLPIQLTSN
jgi:predicted Zn-ribbon and HTH transcriptional regulator